VVKVDTQGAEWEVWRGMQGTVASRPVTVMTEFTPWTFEGRAHPSTFLREISARYHLIDLRPRNMSGGVDETALDCFRVPPEHIDRFVELVAGSSCGWTDLLCIPRAPSWSEDLLEALRPREFFGADKPAG